MVTNIDKSLNEAHKKIQQQISNSKSREDDNFSMELSDFLTYIIYGNQTLEENNSFSNYMNDEFRKIFIKDIQYINNKDLNSYQRGEAGEIVISNILNSIIKEEMPEIRNRISTMTKNVVTGSLNATILDYDSKKDIENLLNNSITNRMAKKIDEELKKADNKYGSFQSKYMKIDADFSKIVIKGEPTALTKKIMNISASIKNYTSHEITLEEVNRKKAYQAIMSELTNLPLSVINGCYESYYDNDMSFLSPDNESVSAHFLHIATLYSLTGYGQSYIDIRTKKLIQTKMGAKFLIANVKNHRKVYVFATVNILDQVFNNNITTNWSKPFSYSIKVNNHDAGFNIMNAKTWKETDRFHVKLNLLQMNNLIS